MELLYLSHNAEPEIVEASFRSLFLKMCNFSYTLKPLPDKDIRFQILIYTKAQQIENWTKIEQTQPQQPQPHSPPPLNLKIHPVSSIQLPFARLQFFVESPHQR
eukprot:TRINITY_DN4624_c0_g2_i1.p1 TRINITY_DN4624_c0_g2~~TRINITY_DN4624_c0_g2_i1.p1  ORF type:complete len:104 (+),score=24.57 TRINITY_DN4624_c0_g2_i1:379-690(+)